MDIGLIVLRLIHIVTGVFWAGGSFVMLSHIVPAAEASGPAGGQFMQRLMQRGLSRALLGAGVFNVLAGILLYLRVSGGLQLDWITSPVGLTFTIGALAALAALIYGGAVTAPAGSRMARLGQEIQTGGKPPTPEQMSQIGTFQNAMVQGARV